MKMQNAILASTKGIIKKVLVKEGDTTSKSDLLIELEKE
jgi:propionyl-CoA carboxylase alpha chain